jgi:hypothetical protein
MNKLTLWIKIFYLPWFQQVPLDLWSMTEILC